MKPNARLLCPAIAMGLLATSAVRAADVGTAFTYQGKLTDNGQPANGAYDFQFRLFSGDWPLGFIQSGPIDVQDLSVVNGMFTVKLDFGTALNGTARWLDVAVRPGPSNGGFTILLPRQELTPAPYAVGLALPYAVSLAYAAPMISLTQTGAGNAMALSSTSGNCIDAATTGNGNALYAHTAGTGSAVAAYTTGNANALYGQATGGGTAVYGYNLGTTGRAGFFRTEVTTNASNAIESQANGTGHAIKANARAASAGFFENTNASNTSSTLRSETNGASLAVWGKTTGTGGAAKFEVSNVASNSPALEVRNDGTGLAAKFTRGNVEVWGNLSAQMGTVMNRATPIAFGKFLHSTLITSSGNVILTFENGNFYIQVVGETGPGNWTVITSLEEGDNVPPNHFWIARAGLPNPNGKFWLSFACVAGCDEFVADNIYVNFVVYKGQ